MGAYSINFYGISISKHFYRIEEAMLETLKATDPGSELLDDFDLASYLEKTRAGSSNYDGGGYRQITYIGVRVPSSKRGVIVTDELAAAAEAKIADMPKLLSDAIKAVFGEIPDPEFITEEGWD